MAVDLQTDSRQILVLIGDIPNPINNLFGDRSFEQLIKIVFANCYGVLGKSREQLFGGSFFSKFSDEHGRFVPVDNHIHRVVSDKFESLSGGGK